MTEQQPEAADAQSESQPESQSGSDPSQESEDSQDKQQLDEGAPGDIGDAQLPEDLQPTEDNPLARHPDQSGDKDDAIGTDREGDPETAPLTAEQADYGDSGSGSDSGSDSGSGSGSGTSPDDGRVDAEEDDGSDTLENGGGGAG